MLGYSCDGGKTLGLLDGSPSLKRGLHGQMGYGCSRRTDRRWAG